MGKSSEAATSSKSDKAPSSAQEQPTPQGYPDWAAMQAYYGPGVAMPPYFSTTVVPGHPPHPFMWSPQPLMTPFGAPYTAIYPPGVYPHPSMPHGSQAPTIAPSSSGNEAIVMLAPLAIEAPTKSSSDKEKSPVKKFKGIDGLVSIANGSAKNSAGDPAQKLTQSRENDTEVSTEGSDGCMESRGKKICRKRSSEDTHNSGKDGKVKTLVSPVPTVVTNGSAHPSFALIPVPADIAEKTASTVAPSNATAGLGLKVSTIVKANPVSPVTSAMLTGSDGALNEHWIQDDRALKRERRKQSNRESARRSRLRKQAETEELAMKVDALTNENLSLRSEINRLREKSENLRLENTALMDKLKKANMNLTEEVVHETGDSHGTKSIGTENLLSRMNNSGSNTNSDQWENEGHENSSGKLYQLLDSSPRTTDAVAAG
ncbi:plant G-box-binding factor protein [Dioscorea alata]|uniref:Plant G-box-binding factor protein n=1 Tax=Dioscorea alata TaxID=55571 RepID=A0ACB7W4T7_DIOAL|nr:plant G-box-binding factor protein [Dioscorea alata]